MKKRIFETDEQRLAVYKITKPNPSKKYIAPSYLIKEHEEELRRINNRSFFEERDKLNKLFKKTTKLTRKERYIIYLYYIKEVTLDDIGQLLGVTYRRVIHIRNSGLKKMSMNYHEPHLQ